LGKTFSALFRAFPRLKIGMGLYSMSDNDLRQEFEKSEFSALFCAIPPK